MTLWWIGNALLALVVAPLVIFLANRLVRLALEIRRYADDILEHGVGLTGTLDSIPKLVTTSQLTGTALGLVGRYGAALADLLPGPGTPSAASPAPSAPSPAPTQNPRGGPSQNPRGPRRRRTRPLSIEPGADN